MLWQNLSVKRSAQHKGESAAGGREISGGNSSGRTLHYVTLDVVMSNPLPNSPPPRLHWPMRSYHSALAPSRQPCSFV